MKSIPLLFVILVALSLPVFSQRDTLFTGTDICPSGGWQLVFDDEFYGSELDLTKWFTWFPYAADGSDQCGFCRTHGEEGQVYSDSNVMVSDSTLKLIVRRQDIQWYGHKRAYSSGMIQSRLQFGKGRYEIRCKIPYGMGFWPAFWMFGDKGSEIDVFEIGCQRPHRYHIGLLAWKTHSGFGKRKWSRVNFSKDFHIFTVVWDTYWIRYLVDKKEVWKVSLLQPKCGKVMRTCNPPNDTYMLQPAFPADGDKVNIIANLAIGTAKTPFTKAPAASTVIPNQFEVD
jgi:beta-glucanase (GH16 family)